MMMFLKSISVKFYGVILCSHEILLYAISFLEKVGLYAYLVKVGLHAFLVKVELYASHG
jgi:hypothetical protein